MIAFVIGFAHSSGLIYLSSWNGESDGIVESGLLLSGEGDIALAVFGEVVGRLVVDEVVFVVAGDVALLEDIITICL